MPKEYKSDFSDDPDYYNDDDPANRTKANIIDDNFDDELRDKLTAPTADSVIAEAIAHHNDIPIILWRGTTGPRVKDMIEFGCAAGKAKDADSARPSEAQRKQQISKGGIVPEFTTRKTLSFGFMHWMAVVEIKARYLAKGSGSENGWVCLPTAPLRVLETVDRTLGFEEETSAANAS